MCARTELYVSFRRSSRLESEVLFAREGKAVLVCPVRPCVYDRGSKTDEHDNKPEKEEWRGIRYIVVVPTHPRKPKN